LKLKCYEPLSKVAFTFNVRRYTEAVRKTSQALAAAAAAEARVADAERRAAAGTSAAAAAAGAATESAEVQRAVDDARWRLEVLTTQHSTEMMQAKAGPVTHSLVLNAGAGVP
jgi:hypothetical protein